MIYQRIEKSEEHWINRRVNIRGSQKISSAIMDIKTESPLSLPQDSHPSFKIFFANNSPFIPCHSNGIDGRHKRQVRIDEPENGFSPRLSLHPSPAPTH